MPSFDLDAYFASKAATSNVDSKLADLEAASKAKMVDLQEHRDAAEQFMATKAANDKIVSESWAGRLGLPSGEVPSNLVNDAASLVAGTSRLAGQVGSVVPGLMATTADMGQSAEDTNAWNRIKSGQGTPIDNLILDRRNPGSDKTIRQGFMDAEANQKTSRQVTDFFNLDKIVDPTNRNNLTKDLSKGFQEPWAQLSAGVDAASNGDVLGGSVNAVEGLAKIFYNAGSAVLSNPAAVREFVLENAPQLFVGLAGAPGKAAMLASNIGYAADNYQQFIENYAKENNGQLPPKELMVDMAMKSASLAAAEQASDVVGLGVTKLGRKTAEGAVDATRSGFKESLKNIGKAAGTGFVSEAPTEGYQTYMEGNITGKDVSATDIFTGSVIGGVSGATLSGGGRTLAELSGATPEKLLARKDQTNKTDVLKTAIQTGDVTALLDPKSKAYSPDTAVHALHENSKLDTTTPEARQANLEQASKIISDLETQRIDIQSSLDRTTPSGLQAQLATLKERLANLDPADVKTAAEYTDGIAFFEEELQTMALRDSSAEIKGYKDQLASIDKQLADANKTITEFNQTVAGKTDFAADLAALNVPADASTPEATAASQVAANRIINLSMASPELLDAKTATELANNAGNALTEPQRAYLRSFSAARIAANAIKSKNNVSDEILYGSPAGSAIKNVGIEQYRAQITAALAAGNQALADKKLELLNKFKQDHLAKAKAVADAFELYRKDAVWRQVRSDGNRGWFTETADGMTKEGRDALRAEGGVLVNNFTFKLAPRIENEATAITAAATELQSAYEVKFNTQSATQQGAANVQDVSQQQEVPSEGSSSQSEQPARQAAAPAEPQSSGATETATTAEGTGSGVVQEPSITAVAEEAPASSANTEQTQAVTTVEDQIQATEEATAPAAETVPQTAATTEAEQPVVESTETADPTEDMASVVEPGTLSAFQQTSPEGTRYQLRNLIADFFVQSEDKATDASGRPLVAVKDFLSQSAKSVMDFLSIDSLSSQQSEAISVFKAKAKAWQSNITKNLGNKKQEFWFEDMMNFFVVETNGKKDIEENLKTAMSYAAFSWIAEVASRAAFNTDEEINIILDRPETELVTQEERNTLGMVGARQNIVINALGKRAIQALGLKAKQDAPRDLMPKLESAIGAHIMKLLMDQGILERTTVTGEVMAGLTKSEKTQANAKFQFLRLARDAEFETTQQVKEIVKAITGSHGVLDKLFSVESALKEPSYEPVPFTQQTTRNTSQGVPKTLGKVIEQENSVPSFVRQDMVQLISQLGEDTALAIAGVEEVSEQGVHVSNRLGRQAKNDGLKRELERFMLFVTGMADMEAPLYFEHSVWKQQRVGISTNLINPQTSKIHRFMLYRQAWETKLDMNNDAQMDNFRLRVLEGLGVKTDKQSNATSLAGYDNYVGAPEIKAAVEVLRKSVFEGGITPAEEKILVAGVKAGGQNFHSLDALMALAHEAQARLDGKNEFTVQMMGEVDGVTNGPMLSHLMLGAAETAEDLFKLLNRGGFYEQGNEHSQYNLWREAIGHRDLYEQTALSMTQAVQSLLNKTPALGATLNAIYAFTGTLADKDGSVTKAGRNIIKTPLTAMVFGSSVITAVDSMANGFVESIYAGIEDVAAGKVDVRTVIGHINTLLIMGKGATIPAMSVERLMEFEFNPGQIKALKKSFKDTIGKTVQSTMETEFKTFIERRESFNKSAKTAFEIYNAAYTSLKDAYLAELVTSGDVEVNPTTKAPLHDLTAKQEAELRKRLSALTPILHTLMSKESKSLKSGINMSKSERKLSTRGTYQSEIKFGSRFTDNNAASSNVNGVEVVASEPGVAMLPMSAHSTDSAISHGVENPGDSLNVHDARGAGVGILGDVARSLNQSTWNAMLNYSPATEMADALSRTIRGLAQLLSKEDTPVEVRNAVMDAIADISIKKGTSAATLLGDMLSSARSMAFRADSVRLEVLGQMQAIDQYAMQDGNYQVTEQDRAAAQAMRADLTNDLTEQETDALQQIAESFSTEYVPTPQEPPVVATVESAFGKVGTPTIKSDTDLVEFFDANPNASATDVIKLLAAPGRLNGINRKILGLISRVVSPNLSIKYVTPETSADMPLEKPTTSARGWYVLKNGKEEIYVLSPEFVNSGLTAETLLHELIHAAIAQTIDNPSAAAAELVAELDALRIKAQAFAKQNGLTQFSAALENVQEFVTWGMTNLEFQRAVLSKISMESKTKKNKLMTGLEAFIKAVSQLLFKNPDENLNNGVAVLFANVSGLFAEAAQNKPKENTSLNLAQEAQQAIEQYTTQDIFQGLDTGAVSPAFSKHLSNLLGGIVEKLHGPFGAFAQAMRKTEASNPLATWLKAMETGAAPFASSIVGSGFAGSAQEDFAMQQIEATVRAALEANEPQARTAYRELYKLYTFAQKTLKPSDFDSQEDYDFVFKLEAGSDGRSDYIARFAAMGLGSQKFNSLLKIATDRDTSKFGEGESFTERLQNIFEKILNFFNEKITHTFQGQDADAKLEILVGQLVDIEAKRRTQIAARLQATDYLGPVEENVTKVVTNIKNGIVKIASSDMVRDSSLSIVRTAGSLARTIAGERVEAALEGIQAFHAAHVKNRQSIAMSMLKEVTGHNKLFQLVLRATKKLESTRKSVIDQTSEFSRKSFANNGKDLSRTDKESITKVFLRTGLHNLTADYSLAEIENLLNNPTALEAAIKKYEGQLTGPMKNNYILQANVLGSHLANGEVVGFLMGNSHIIARMLGDSTYSSRITEEAAVAAEPSIKMLVSLYALRATRVEQQMRAKQVMRTENNRNDGNGIEYVMALQKAFEKESLEKLFKGNPILMQHAYTPEVYNPYVQLELATETGAQDLIDQGYERVDDLKIDRANPYGEQMILFALRGVGVTPRVSGAMHTQTLRAKGTEQHNGFLDATTSTGLENSIIQATITNNKLGLLKQINNPGRDMSGDTGNNLAPVYNEQGEIVNWRYLMKEKTKDNLLERNNDFDKLLGVLAGSVFDKETTKDQNKVVIEALHEEFKTNYAMNRAAYVLIGPNTGDPELREIWDLMPRQAQIDAREIWGKDGMLVRADSLDMIFGYRKFSMADMFKRAEAERKQYADIGMEFVKNKELKSLNSYEQIFVGVVEWLLTAYASNKLGMDDRAAERYAKRAAVYVARTERAWQEIVRETKDIIVVKTGTVMLGNIFSNKSLLLLAGMSPWAIAEHTLVALKAATAYQKHDKELNRLQSLLDTGYTQGKEAEIKREIIRLKDALARNPVKELIDAGLMPTIVEDLSGQDDVYSYKSALTKKVEKATSKLNPNIVNIGKAIYMTRDGQMYNTLSKITQMSDFVARYALYQHLTTKAKNPLSKADAIQKASDYFVNYDIPMHRALQYTDDMGITAFTKYFLRIQKPLLDLAKENPARVLGTVLLGNFMSLGPIVLDSSFIHHLGNNPIRSGPFDYLGSLKELATVKSAMVLIK